MAAPRTPTARLYGPASPEKVFQVLVHRRKDGTFPIYAKDGSRVSGLVRLTALG